jgi:TatD DNase family protein
LILIDSHCHLDFLEFESDLGDVLNRSLNVGVAAVQTMSVSLSNFHKVIKVTSNSDNIYCSVGVHPSNVLTEGLFTADRLIALTKHPKVIGIGETGLDYYRDTSSKDLQIMSFKEHIRTSQSTGLPLIVHTRDAEEDTLEILSAYFKEKNFKAVIHCFTGSTDFAKSCLELGFYISFSGIVTFKNATDLQFALKQIPIERMLIETDAPYLAPTPYRGKRNEPSYIEYTAKFIADLKDIPYNEFCDKTSYNFLSLFDKVRLK